MDKLEKVSGGSAWDTIKGKVKDNGGDALGTLMSGKKKEKPSSEGGSGAKKFFDDGSGDAEFFGDEPQGPTLEFGDPFSRKKMWD